VKDGELGLIPVFVSKVPKRALAVEFPYRGKTERFDLASKQGPNGPDAPLDTTPDPERSALLTRLADQVAGWLEKTTPSNPSRERTSRPRAAAPPVSPADRRPLLTVQLRRWHGKLIRRYFFEGGLQPREFPASSTDAEYALSTWRACLPFDGDQLYELLFGGDSGTAELILRAASGQEDAQKVPPTRYPFRIRLLTDDQDLMGLPWASISHRGNPLRNSGWTVELGLQPNEDEAPKLANHSLAMPGPILVAVSKALRFQGHADDLRGLFRALWPKRDAVFEVQDLEDLEQQLRERSPRLFYWFGPGRWDRATHSYTLELETRDGERVEVGLVDIASYFSSRAPQVCFFNLIDDQGCRGMSDAGRLLSHARAVILNAASQQEIDRAAETGFRWMEHLLVHRSDPVIAFHHAAAPSGGCWTDYDDWRTDSSGSLDDDLVEFFLDRNEQSEHLLGACGELVNRETPLRVQCRLAIGAKGNRVMDFGRQATFFLAENAFPGSYCYARGPVRLYTEATTPKDVETSYRRFHGLGPNADLFAPLRTQAGGVTGDLQVPLLSWVLEADEGASAEPLAEIAKAALEWTWEALAIGCPDELRVICLLLIETPDNEQVQVVKSALRDHEKALRVRAGSRPSFKFREMRRLGGVDETHLRDYFDSPMCWCWDNLRSDYPGLLMAGRDEMPFDEAVRHIKQAKRSGWGVMATRLQEQSKRASK
jgi:hypothetical protein